MDPVTAIAVGSVAVGAVTGIANYFQAEKARKASNKKLDEIKALYDKIKPPNYNVDITDPPELHEYELQKPMYRKWLEKTKYDMSTIKRMGKFVPQYAEFIKEDAPELIKENKTTKRGRDAQIKALDEFERVADSNDDPRFRMLVDRAKRRAQSEAQSRGKSLQSQYARRGMLGSGIQLASEIGSNAEAMDRLADTEQQAAADLYRNRLEALATGADLGARIRRDDQDLQSRNNSLINSFNQRMSARRQALADRRANVSNDAAMMNLREDQRLEELNRRRFDELKSRARAEDERGLARSDRLADLEYNRGMSERDYQNKIREFKARWKEDQRDKKNNMMSRSYQDQLSRAAGSAGMMNARRERDLQASRDRMDRNTAFGDVAVKAADLYARSGRGGRRGSNDDYYYDDDEYDYERRRRKQPYTSGIIHA